MFSLTAETELISGKGHTDIGKPCFKTVDTRWSSPLLPLRKKNHHMASVAMAPCKAFYEYVVFPLRKYLRGKSFQVDDECERIGYRVSGMFGTWPQISQHSSHGEVRERCLWACFLTMGSLMTPSANRWRWTKE